MEKNQIDIVRVKLIDDKSLYSDVKIETIEDAISVIGKELVQCDREVLCVANVNSIGQVINLNIASMGILNTVIVHPREIFKSSILSNAAGIIVMHNHLSGDIRPSKEDISATERLKKAGEIIGIRLLDHIIVGDKYGRYYSFKDDKICEKKMKSKEKNTYER